MMKIGKVERLALLLLKQQNMNAGAIATILRAKGIVKTGLSARRAIKTLQRKGFIDDSNKLTQKGSRYTKSVTNSDNVGVNVGDLDVSVLGKNLKLGTKAKILLYILAKIDHASLQFLMMITTEHTKNISAVLTRLEYNGLVYGYRNMLKFSNVRGRRYRPKYYRITSLGRIVSLATRAEIKNAKAIDAVLEDTLKLKSEMNKPRG
jgi:DNA-binding PadR family transcriptional regulator